MLKATLTPHRENLLTQTAGQKLFVALTVQPGEEASAARPQLSVAFVVDTSGSMRETVTEPTERTGRTTVVDGQRYEVVRGAKSKMDLVTEALTGVFASTLLQTDDRLALVKFDDKAEVLLPFTEAQDRDTLRRAVERLSDFSGGTLMGAGMQEALELLRLEQGSKRLLLLTDGRTSDEDTVREVGAALAEDRVAVTTIGVGEEWNEELLTELTDRTQGKPYYVVPDVQDPQPPAVRMTDLPDELMNELERTTNEVVTGASSERSHGQRGDARARHPRVPDAKRSGPDGCAALSGQCQSRGGHGLHPRVHPARETERTDALGAASAYL